MRVLLVLRSWMVVLLLRLLLLLLLRCVLIAKRDLRIVEQMRAVIRMLCGKSMHNRDEVLVGLLGTECEVEHVDWLRDGVVGKVLGARVLWRRRRACVVICNSTIRWHLAGGHGRRRWGRGLGNVHIVGLHTLADPVEGLRTNGVGLYLPTRSTATRVRRQTTQDAGLCTRTT